MKHIAYDSLLSQKGVPKARDDLSSGAKKIKKGEKEAAYVKSFGNINKKLKALGAQMLMTLESYSWKHERIFLILPFIVFPFFTFAPDLVASIILGSSVAAIALEKKTGFDKLVPSLIAFGLLWLGIGLFRYDLLVTTDITIGNQTEEIGAVVFMLKNSISIVIFLMAAMIAVDLLNDLGAFGSFINKLRENKYLTGLILISSPIIFVLSWIFDNMTTALIFAAITSPIITGRFRIMYLGLVVICANAGGLVSIVGDPPTTFMYLKGKITEVPTFVWGILPAMVAAMIPAVNLYLKAKKENILLKWSDEKSETNNFAFILGLLVLAGVPIGKYFFHLEPFLTICCSTAIVLMYAIMKGETHKVEHVLKHIDWMGLGYFLTILGSVCALETLGTIHVLGSIIEVIIAIGNEAGIETVYIITLLAMALGIVSAYVDNIPIVVLCVAVFASTPTDDSTWHLLNYFLNTGGSLTIIGSAAGVMLMNRYHIDFTSYQKLVFRPAFWGYAGGGFVALMQQVIYQNYFLN